MAIEPACVPETAVRAVADGIAGRLAEGHFAARNLPKGPVDGLSLAMPHRIAYLPFGEIQPDLDLRKAVQLGSWRFLVHHREAAAGKLEYRLVAAVTAVAKKERDELGELNEHHELGSFHEGPLAAATEEAIHRAETLSEVRSGRFEAALLMVPSVYALALWLQDRGGYGETDILLPIPPSHSDFKLFQPMSPAAFVGLLKSLAAKAKAEAEAN
jgi:hypothetical protein